MSYKREIISKVIQNADTMARSGEFLERRGKRETKGSKMIS